MSESIDRLSPAMRSHMTYGLGGALQRTLDALERRGLIALVPHRCPSGRVDMVYQLTKAGERVRESLRASAGVVR